MKFVVLAILFLAVSCKLQQESALFVSKEFTIAPGQSKSGQNPLPFSVSGSCTVVSLTGTAKLCAYVESGSASLDGQSVSSNKNDMTCLELTQGQTISATVGGSATLFGDYVSGQSNLTANCSANLQEMSFNKVGQNLGISKTFTIHPGQSGNGTSPLPFPVSGSCTINNLTGTAVLCGYITAGSASINGTAVSTDSSNPSCYTVSQGDTANAQGSAGVGGWGIYKSSSDNSSLTATCSANLGEEEVEFQSLGITKSFTINPGQNKQVTSPLPFSASATCTVTSLSGEATLCAYVISGTATINGNNVSTSESSPTCMTVEQGSTLNASISASAEVYGIYKQGNGPLTGSCTVNLDAEEY